MPVNEIQIPIQQGQTLADALKNKGYQAIPSNAIIDKTLTGIGATYMEIHTPRPSIIIEPNVPVIKGKVEQHPNCLAVVKGVKEPTIKNYLNNDSVQFKKILTTPESFSKIGKAASEIGLDIYNTFFCLFDECEKIGQDIDYRDSIAFPINDFFKFKEKAFVSATPLQMIHDEFDKQQFSRLVVSPQFDYKEELSLIVTDAIRKEFATHVNTLLDQNRQSICIFFNSTAGIRALIELFEIPANQYAVFCSDKSKNELKQKGIEAECNFNPLLLRRFNFFTSRFYSAVDFNLTVCPDVVIVTDLNEASYTTVDPLSESIQIQGRFRKKQPNGKRYNSLTHISNIRLLSYMSHDEVLEELNTWFITATALKERYLTSTSATQKQAISKEFKKCSIYPYLDTPDIEHDFKRNTFALINRYNKERVAEYYTNGEKLNQAYLKSNYFDVSFTDKIDRSFNFDFNPKDLVKKISNKRTSQKDKINAILEQIRRGIPANTIQGLFKDASLAEMYSNISNIIEAVELIGIETVRTKTTFKAIEKMLHNARLLKRSDDKRFSPELISSLHKLFASRMGEQIPKTDTKQALQTLYSSYGILAKNGKPFKVTLTTILEYYDSKKNNQKDTYTLHSLWPHLAEKIQAESNFSRNG
ncbi:MAG: hypothetical protein ACK5M7_05880 [Draconibacterium sp.]